jgi:hypothetical protein
MLRPLLFFRVAPPNPRLMTGTTVIVTAMCAVVTAVDPRRCTGALTTICLVQLFAASSGFGAPARRGHYDLLLTRGDPRVAIGLAHWCMSVVAGLASWMVIGGLEVLLTGAARRSLAPGTVSAMLLASSIPWATAIALPRFAGAVGWLVVMVLTATLAPQLVLSPSTAPSPLLALGVLFVPSTFMGAPFPGSGLVALPAAATAVVCMAAAIWWIHMADVPLETAQ